MESLSINQVTIRQITVLVGICGGILSIYLGYLLFVRGITGQFKLKSDLKGLKADLVSAGPGLFFALIGAAIIWTALSHGFQIKIESNQSKSIIGTKDVQNPSASEPLKPTKSTPPVIVIENAQKIPTKPGDQLTISVSVHNTGTKHNEEIIFSSIESTMSANELLEMAKRNKLWRIIQRRTLDPQKRTDRSDADCGQK